MALVLADRVEQVTRTTGLADLELAEVIRGRQSFQSVTSDGDTVIYVLEDAEGISWEIGTGTVVHGTPTVLQRTTVRQSSNSDAKISLSAGTHRVYMVVDAKYINDNLAGASISQADLDQAITDHEGEADPHSQYTTVAEAASAAPVQSVNSQTGTVSLEAVNVPYDNSASGLTASELQAAVDELAASGGSGTDDQTAAEVSYSNSTSGLTATQVQAAIDELAAAGGSGTDDQTAAEVSYSNSSSGLTATDVQAAIDEVDSDLDTHVGASDPHPQYTTSAEAAAAAPVQTVNSQTGDVSLDAADVGATPAGHVGTGGTEHANATTSVAGFMSASDKTKLDTVEPNATADQTAAEVPYTNTTSGLTATQVQAALDELASVSGGGDPYFSSISGIEALTPAAGDTAYLTQAGRSGRFIFRSGDQSARVSSDPLQGVWVAPSSTPSGASGAWERDNNGVVAVEWFGATTTGDATSSIQAAITFAESNPDGISGVVVFGPNDYRYTTLRISGRITLQGSRETRLIKTSTTGNGIEFGFDGTRRYGGQIIGMSLVVEGTHTSGAVLALDNVGDFYAEDLNIGGSFPNRSFFGIDLVNVANSAFSDIKVTNCLSTGFSMQDCLDIYVSDSRSDVNGGAGYYVHTSSGMYFSQCTAYGNEGNAWNIADSIPSPVLADTHGFMFFTSCVGDTSGDDNWRIEGLRDSSLRGCWGSTHQSGVTDKAGFLIDACENMDIIGSIALTNSSNGLYVYNSSTKISVAGGRFNGNGANASSTNRNGIHIASGCDVVVDGSVCTQNAQVGLQVDASAAGLLLINTNMEGNSGNSYSFGGTPSFFKEDNNRVDDSVTLASSNVVTLPYIGKYFSISGTTDINGLDTQYAGRQVTLIFQGSLTVGDVGTLKLNGNFDASMNTTLTLISDGTNWYEISRSTASGGGSGLTSPVGITDGGTGATTAAGARTNLDVYSKSEVYSTSQSNAIYLNESSNLSDLTSASAARGNLGLDLDGPFTPSFQNGWSDAGISYVSPSYSRDHTGRVYLQGAIEGGSSAVAFTLPFGYRPPRGVGFVVPSQGSPIVMLVNSDGTVEMAGYNMGSSDVAFLDGVTFLT